MQEFLDKVPNSIELASLALMAVVILATVVSKFTKSQKDDELVLKCATFVQKMIAFLPTIGVNPRTKKLEEAYIQLKSKEEVMTTGFKEPQA